MNIQPFQQLACPLDGEALLSDGKSWRCGNGHSYDIARQGYTHLLPVQNMRSRNPGDSKEMIEARQRFLNAGFYGAIATAAAKAVLDGLPLDASVLDAGCGEGYYLRQLIASASEAQSLQVIGVDISKPAMLSAAKQYKASTWVVASNANLPVLKNTVDRIVCIFGFPTYAEFARVLKVGGELLMVEAGPDHLRELREIIYPAVKPDRPADAKIPEGFVAHSTETVSFDFELTSADQISDLLSMTPHLFRASAEGKAKVAALDSLSLTADVRLMRLGVVKAVDEIDIDTEADTESTDIGAGSENPEAVETTEEIESTEEIEKADEVEKVEETEKTEPAFDWTTKRSTF